MADIAYNHRNRSSAQNRRLDWTPGWQSGGDRPPNRNAALSTAWEMAPPHQLRAHPRNSWPSMARLRPPSHIPR